jgi:hypothetical protein
MPAASAFDATVTLGAIEFPDGAAREIAARLDWADDGRVRASITVGEVRRGVRVFSKLRLDCDEASWNGDLLGCRRGVLSRIGEARQREALLRNLDISYDVAGDRLAIRATGDSLGEGTADVAITGHDGAWTVAAKTRQVTAGSWQKLLRAVGAWPEGYEETTGIVDVDADIHLRDGQVDVRRLAVSTAELGFSGAAIADAAALHIEASTAVRDERPVVTVDATLEAGAIYVEPGFRVGDYTPGVTLEPEGQPIRLQATLPVAADGGWQFDQLTVDQPGVVALMVRRGANGDESLQAEVKTTDLARLYGSHIKSHCARLTALCGLELAGGATAAVSWDPEGIRELHLAFDDVYLDDDRQRFRISALAGDLIFSSGATEQRSSLHWERAGWQRLDFGAGKVGMISRERSLKVTEWSDVGLLGGTFKVDELELANVGRPDFSIKLEGVLTPVPMEAFCEAMGWPPMKGTLSGVIPGLTYERGRLDLDGDLLVRIFDGSVVIRGLSIERPFGTAPSLTTDFDVRGIDLEKLTGAFSFGRIEGTLEGEVRDLQLDDWEATAFDGYLQNPADDDRPHRISQKAVDNLSAIGGGIGGALSRGFLRFFQDYSYDRLGLHCRLANGICAMKGVAPASGGFYIVTRGGVLPPWIDVRGSGVPLPDGRFAVAWNDILLGFKRINSGQMKLQ